MNASHPRGTIRLKGRSENPKFLIPNSIPAFAIRCLHDRTNFKFAIERAFAPTVYGTPTGARSSRDTATGAGGARRVVRSGRGTLGGGSRKPAASGRGHDRRTCLDSRHRATSSGSGKLRRNRQRMAGFTGLRHFVGHIRRIGGGSRPRHAGGPRSGQPSHPASLHRLSTALPPRGSRSCIWLLLLQFGGPGRGDCRP